MVTIYVFFFHFFRCVIELCAFDWIIYRIELSVASARYRLINLIKSKIYIYMWIFPTLFFVCLVRLGLYASQNTICVWRFDKLTSSLDSLSHCRCCCCCCVFFSLVVFTENQFIFTTICMGRERATFGFYLILWIILHFDNMKANGCTSHSPSLSLIKAMNALIAKAKSFLAFKQITNNIVAKVYSYSQTNPRA